MPYFHRLTLSFLISSIRNKIVKKRNKYGVNLREALDAERSYVSAVWTIRNIEMRRRQEFRDRQIDNHIRFRLGR